MAKRLLFIDISKGLAILGVILVHALIHGVWFFPSYALDALPLWVLAILSPLVIVATWAGFFELMSGLSNMYNMYDRIIVKKQGFKRAAQGPLVNSTGLLIAHFIFVIFFSHRRNAPYPAVYSGEINSMISGSFELGRFHFTDFQFFFFADVLGSIALAGYFSVFVVWLLYKYDGLTNVERAYKILSVVAVTFFAISYPIWDRGYNLIENLLLDQSSTRPLSLILAVPLSMFTGAFQPFFPIAGFGIIGVILGMLLAVKYHRSDDPDYYINQNIPTAKGFIKRVAPLSLLTFVILLTVYIIGGNDPMDILVFFRLPPIMLALNTALMLWAIMLAIKLFEDPDEATRRSRAKKTVFIRRFGMVSLSVYTFESVINGIFSFTFHFLFDNPATPQYESHTATLPIFGYVILIFAFWFTFVWAWERIGFAYGLEYWVIQIGSKFRSTKSRKLDLTWVLYNPFGKPKEEKLYPSRIAPIPEATD